VGEGGVKPTSEGDPLMPTVKVVGLLLAVSASIVALVALLMREETELWHLILCGCAGGAITGSIWRGRRGLLWGFVIGAVIGFISPVLYIPFWLAFTLPPHPEIDL
jgi:hypothetical protein